MSRCCEPSLPDLFPGCYYLNARPNNTQQGSSICRAILTHFLAMLFTMCLSLGAYYHYNNVYNQNYKEQPVLSRNVEPQKDAEPQSLLTHTENLENKINHLNNEIVAINSWSASINNILSNMEWEQELKIKTAIDNALELYDADGIGLMDYAASYAGGIIVGISKTTRPLPTHRPVSLFKLVNVDLLSSPEEIIRPCVLPGSCFAFGGHSGSIRIKLGKPINIGSVTMSHAAKQLLGPEGMASAPKTFEVYGFLNNWDKTGAFLGKFTYDIEGKPHQTFQIDSDLSKNQMYEEVELWITSNHGKQDFTCVYRFRVHKSNVEDKSTQVHKTKTTCC